MAETDLERFVEAPGRDEKIKQVRAMIDAKGIEYLYLQFVSVTGKIMGKGIPADHWESVAMKGFQLVYGATVNLFTDRAGNYLGYGPEAAELVGIPEPETETPSEELVKQSSHYFLFLHPRQGIFYQAPLPPWRP